MLPFIGEWLPYFGVINQYNSFVEIPGQGSEVRRSATPSSRVSPVSDGTDSSIQHKKIVAVDIHAQGAGKELLIDCVILYASRFCYGVHVSV